MINKVMPIFGKRAVSSGTLLLDLYPNAEVAYSLRYLRTGYIGSPVIRVRRSSDNAELDFTPTEITDGTLTTWVGAGNGFVTIWYDQSLNSKNSEQTVTSIQPIIVSSGVLEQDGSKPCIKFSTANKVMTIPLLQLETSKRFSNYAVIRTGDSGSENNYISAYSNANWSLNVLGGGVRAFFDGIWRNYTSNGIQNTRYLSSVVRNSNTSADISRNGVLATVTVGDVTPSIVNVGLSRHITTTSGASTNRIMQELIHYSSDQSVNSALIQTDINTYYSIY